MTIAELIKEFIESSRERIKTPITGSFLLAFLLYNWRPLLLLMFSDAMMEDKIVVINNEYCTWDAIILPLLISVFYVAGVQYIMLWFDKLTTSAHKGRQVNRYNRQIHDLTAYRKVLEEQRTNENIRSGNMERGQLNDQIENLKKENEALNLEKQSEQRKYENELDELSKTLNEAADDIDKYSKAASLNEKKNAYLLKNTTIYNALSMLSIQQANDFIAFADFYVYGHTDKVTINGNHEDLFVDLNLIKYTNNDYHLTELGEKVYKYLKIE